MTSFKEVAVHVLTKVGLSTFIERRYGYERTVRASAAIGAGATVNTTFEVQTRKIVLLFVDVTAFAGTSLTFNLQVQNPLVTANWDTVKSFDASEVDNKVLIIQVGGGTDADPIFYANLACPPNSRVRIQGVHVGVTGATYSVASIEMENG